jgi:hypothetical protein
MSEETVDNPGVIAFPPALYADPSDWTIASF